MENVDTFDLPKVIKVYINEDNVVMVRYRAYDDEDECDLSVWYQINWDGLYTDEHTVESIDDETGTVIVRFDDNRGTCEIKLEEYITYNPRFKNASFIDEYYCGKSGAYWSNAYPDDENSDYKVKWRGYLTCTLWE
jgi:hypothetical protein